jgi:hypothetical protein
MSSIQEIHDIEIGGGLAWPRMGESSSIPAAHSIRHHACGCTVKRCSIALTRRRAWIRDQARDKFDAAFTPTEPRANPIVQRLSEASIPGSVYWIYDSAFGMTVGDKKGGASSFAEAEKWLAETRRLQGLTGL